MRWTALMLAMSGLLITQPAVAAPAGGPRATVQAAIGRILSLASDGAAQSVSVADRDAAMRRVAGDVFDFEAMARRALARHWSERTPAEQAEFVGLFRELLERSYLGMLHGYHGEQLSFVSETIAGDHATVRSRLLTQRGREVPIEFRLHTRDGRWRVYDVATSGFSLVSSYQSQFEHVIKTESYDALCNRLRKKNLDGALGAGRGSES